MLTMQQRGANVCIGVLAGEAALFEFLDGKWKERGRGEMRVNTPRTAGAARMLMRQRGNLRLIMNATLYPSMTTSAMLGGKGITFACVNHAAAAAAPGAGAEATTTAAEKDAANGEAASQAAAADGAKAAAAAEAKTEGAVPKLGTYAVKFRSQQLAEDFKRVVETCKERK